MPQSNSFDDLLSRLDTTRKRLFSTQAVSPGMESGELMGDEGGTQYESSGSDYRKRLEDVIQRMLRALEVMEEDALRPREEWVRKIRDAYVSPDSPNPLKKLYHWITKADYSLRGGDAMADALAQKIEQQSRQQYLSAINDFIGKLAPLQNTEFRTIADTALRSARSAIEGAKTIWGQMNAERGLNIKQQEADTRRAQADALIEKLRAQTGLTQTQTEKLRQAIDNPLLAADNPISAATALGMALPGYEQDPVGTVSSVLARLKIGERLPDILSKYLGSGGSVSQTTTPKVFLDVSGTPRLVDTTSTTVKKPSIDRESILRTLSLIDPGIKISDILPGGKLNPLPKNAAFQAETEGVRVPRTFAQPKPPISPEERSRESQPTGAQPERKPLIDAPPTIPELANKEAKLYDPKHVSGRIIPESSQGAPLEDLILPSQYKDKRQEIMTKSQISMLLSNVYNGYVSGAAHKVHGAFKNPGATAQLLRQALEVMRGKHFESTSGIYSQLQDVFDRVFGRLEADPGSPEFRYYIAFRDLATQAVADYIKEISGAQSSYMEANRLIGRFPQLISSPDHALASVLSLAIRSNLVRTLRDRGLRGSMIDLVLTAVDRDIDNHILKLYNKARQGHASRQENLESYKKYFLKPEDVDYESLLADWMHKRGVQIPGYKIIPSAERTRDLVRRDLDDSLADKAKKRILELRSRGIGSVLR